MNMTVIEYLINIIVVVPVILILIVVSLKLSKKSIDKLNNASYIQVIERTSINKETSLYVIKIGATGCVVIASNNSTEVIKELNENEIDEIMKMKKDKYNSVNLSQISGLEIKDILKKKFIRKKENGYIK